MEKNKGIICPVCKHSDISFFCQKNGFYLYKCKHCFLKFVWPIPANLESIYKENYFYKKGKKSGLGYTSYDEDKEPMRGIFLNCLSDLEKIITGRMIFDVGAATGYFLDLARERGWKTAGSEISTFAAKEAANKGHKIYQGSLLDYEEKIKYDLVSLWDVFEHVENPDKYLRKINRMLEKHGFVLINTIDADSFWAKFWGKRWNMIVPPEHLFYFSKKSLKILLNNNGFEIIKIEKLSKKFSLSYIFKILYEWQRVPVWRWLADFSNSRFWRKFKIPINVRDNIFVLAKKRKDV